MAGVEDDDGILNVTPPDVDADNDAGILAEIGALPPGALLTEAGLARIMRKHPASIRRAVGRGELPPPIRLMGKPTWTAGAILSHLERRLEQAAKEQARLQQKISQLSP